MKKTDRESFSKEAQKPDWRESDFAKTIDGQIMLLLRDAIVDKHYIEAQSLSWSAIEEILLPRLIGWIAKIQKIKLPEEVDRMGAQNKNILYLCISYDELLFRKLEQARKKRNKITHQLTSLSSLEDINIKAKDATKDNVLLQQAIMKRFNGEVLIPSINQYKKGWNDALERLKKKLLDEKRLIPRLSLRPVVVCCPAYGATSLSR